MSEITKNCLIVTIKSGYEKYFRDVSIKHIAGIAIFVRYAILIDDGQIIALPVFLISLILT